MFPTQLSYVAATVKFCACFPTQLNKQQWSLNPTRTLLAPSLNWQFQTILQLTLKGKYEMNISKYIESRSDSVFNEQMAAYKTN